MQLVDQWQHDAAHLSDLLLRRVELARQEFFCARHK